MADPKGSAAKQPEVQQRGGEALERRSPAPDLFSRSPFEFMRRMSEEMDRVFDRMFDDFGVRPRSIAQTEAVWTPRIEAFQSGDKFIVRAELPGVKKDDVEVNVTDDAITIQGQRQHEHEEKREGYYHSERSYGSFYRAIPLPEGTIGDTADASFKDGVLEITLQAPPHEVSRGRKIAIREASEKSER